MIRAFFRPLQPFFKGVLPAAFNEVGEIDPSSLSFSLNTSIDLSETASGSWQRIAPWGDFPNEVHHPDGRTTMGVQRIGPEDGHRLVEAFNKERGGVFSKGLPIWVGHPLLNEPPDTDAAAVGRMRKLEVRADGVYANTVLNKNGKALGGEAPQYTSWSPEFRVAQDPGDPQIVRPVFLMAAGLTNFPAIRGLPVSLNKQPSNTATYNMKNLGTYMRSLIEAYNEKNPDERITLEDVGNLMGIDDGTVGQILNGKIKLVPDHRLRAFAKKFGVSFESLAELRPKGATTKNSMRTDLLEKLGLDVSSSQEEIDSKVAALLANSVQGTAAEHLAAAEQENALNAAAELLKAKAPNAAATAAAQAAAAAKDAELQALKEQAADARLKLAVAEGRVTEAEAVALREQLLASDAEGAEQLHADIEAKPVTKNASPAESLSKVAGLRSSARLGGGGDMEALINQAAKDGNYDLNDPDGYSRASAAAYNKNPEAFKQTA